MEQGGGDTPGGPRESDRLSTPPAIELRHLRYFLAVSEELHFGRAAERLHIAQPPLSQAIRKLEGELGVVLLNRTSRVVTLTEAGTAFAQETRRVLARVDAAVAETRRAGGAGSALRIGCVTHLPMERLLGFLSALHERSPDTPAVVSHLFSLEQVRRLRDRELDVGIFDYAEDHAGLEVEPLLPGEPLAAFLPRAHDLAGRDVLRPEDIRDETLVVFPHEWNPALNDRLAASIAAAGYRFEARREATATSPRDVVLAVANGLGIALAPTSLADVTQAAGIVVRCPLDPPVAMPDTVVAWRKNPPRHLWEVLKSVREVARELRSSTDRDGRALS